jgi:CDP-alcohol phosphatidyltransferase
VNTIPRARKPTVADIRKGYDEKKRSFDRQFVSGPLFRHVSFYPTALFARLGISPAQATWVSFLLGMAGCLLMAHGGRDWVLAGAIGVVSWFVIDFVDGNLARYLQSSSRGGKFLDEVVGELVEVAVFFCAGIGLYRVPVYSLGLRFDPGWYPVAGALASLSIVLNSAFHAKFRGLFAVPDDGPGEQRAPDAGRPSLLLLLHRNLVNFAGLVVPLLLLAAIGNGVDLFLLFYCASYFLTFAASLASLLRKAGRRTAA